MGEPSGALGEAEIASVPAQCRQHGGDDVRGVEDVVHLLGLVVVDEDIRQHHLAHLQPAVEQALAGQVVPTEPKPLNTDLIRRLVQSHEVLITIEEGSVGGFGSFVLQYLAGEGPARPRAEGAPDGAAGCLHRPRQAREDVRRGRSQRPAHRRHRAVDTGPSMSAISASPSAPDGLPTRYPQKSCAVVPTADGSRLPGGAIGQLKQKRPRLPFLPALASPIRQQEKALAVRARAYFYGRASAQESRWGSSFDLDGDDLARNHRVVGNMVVIAEDELQRVRPGRQCHGRLGLAHAKMTVLVVFRNSALVVGKFLIDQQVVMTGILLLGAGRRYPHAGQPELHGDRPGDLGAILGLDEIDFGTRRRRLPGSPAPRQRQCW